MEEQKKEFNSDLFNIDKSKLISKDQKDDFKSFFLILSLIYNDLKGIIFFQKTIEDNYRKPNIDEDTSHAAEYSGIIVQTNRILITLIVEFISFIEENRNVITDPRFSLLMKRIDKETKRNWAYLINPEVEKNSIMSKMRIIRSNVSSHYDHSLKQLRTGYIKCFFGGDGLNTHNKAFYTFGNTMKLTRFCYADAAVQEYVNSLMGENIDSMRSFVEKLNHTLRIMIYKYLTSLH
jgi:hypothetical protein